MSLSCLSTSRIMRNTWSYYPYVPKHITWHSAYKENTYVLSIWRTSMNPATKNCWVWRSLNYSKKVRCVESKGVASFFYSTDHQVIDLQFSQRYISINLIHPWNSLIPPAGRQKWQSHLPTLPTAQPSSNTLPIAQAWKIFLVTSWSLSLTLPSPTSAGLVDSICWRDWESAPHWLPSKLTSFLSQLQRSPSRSFCIYWKQTQQNKQQ